MPHEGDAAGRTPLGFRCVQGHANRDGHLSRQYRAPAVQSRCTRTVHVRSTIMREPMERLRADFRWLSDDEKREFLERLEEEG